MSYAFDPSPLVSLPVTNQAHRFPVHRVYCVGRNYAEHAKEMGFTGREPPFFFLKPADALLVVPADQTGTMPYPPLTQDLHHEVELVVAIGQGGRDIPVDQALSHVYGYAVGLDMTRRDLQAEMKKQGRPWCIGKAFDHSAPIGPIVPASQLAGITQAEIKLEVNSVTRQHSQINKLIWNIQETIAHLSRAWTLMPGDLIFTGTPEGVGAVVPGDEMTAHITGLPSLRIAIAA